MANTVIANTFQTFQAKGLRESLSNIIYNISPTDTVFMSNAGREGADAVLSEWQQDSLADADTSNAQIEGVDHTEFAAVTPTVRVGNYVQISSKDVIVSGTLEAVSKAGRKKEMAYQTSLKSAELKRDMEAICLTLQAAAAGSSSVARKTASLSSWIKTNTDFDATSGVDPVYTSLPNNARTDSSATRTWTEAILKSLIQKVWTAGGKIDTLLVGPSLKVTTSGFDGIATKTFYTQAAKPISIIGAADVYVSDFGTLSVVPSRFMRSRDAFLLDWEYIALMYLRPFQTIDLAKTGDAAKRLLQVEWGTKVKHEAALAGGYDLAAA